MSNATVDFAAGTVAGMTAMIVDYPLDTVKTHIQAYGTSSLYRGYWDCVRCVYRRGGFFAFYAGLPVPLLAQGAENAILFSVYNTVLLWCQPPCGVRDASSVLAPHLPVWRQREKWIAAASAGAVVSFVLTPAEYLKCNMQVLRSQRPHTCSRASLTGVACETFERHGVLGFFRGFTGTLARAVPGNVAYFLTYEQVRGWLGGAGRDAGGRGDVVLWKTMLAGGLSGCAYWSVFFPADVVKTRMQVDPTMAHETFTRAFRRQIEEGGMRGLYHGWTLAAMRSFSSSAAVFSVYEWCRSVWQMGPPAEGMRSPPRDRPSVSWSVVGKPPYGSSVGVGGYARNIAPNTPGLMCPFT